jgi:hypothetical protein
MLLSHEIYMDNNWRPGRTVLRSRCGLGLVDPSKALVVFVLPESIKDRPLLWMVVRSQTYYPEHILASGSRKTCYSLVMGSVSFWTDFSGWELGGGLSTILIRGLRCWGLGVQVWMRT